MVGAFHGLSRARSDARRYPSIDPLDSWSKYTGIIEPAKVETVRQTLRRGNEVHQMMTVVGEEGTPIGDFTIMLKAEFFDNCYLQQNAFDDVDAATPRERQEFIFDKILAILKLDFDFESREQARATMFQVQDLFRNCNFAATDSDEYNELLRQIDAFIETKGAAAETAEKTMTNNETSNEESQE